MSATLREAEPGDCQEATELLRRLGLVMPQGRDPIEAHWKRFWVDNPAFIEDRAKPANGWLLEEAGRMVGFFGNIPLLYYYGDRPVIVADASQWGVEKSHRPETGRLADAYFGQSNADMLLVTTGIKPTGRLFERYGAARIPQPDYDRVLYWVVDVGGFIASASRKKGLSAPLASLACTLGGPLAGAAMALAGRRPKPATGSVDLIGIDDLGDDFDDLWRRKRDEAPRLLACRTADCLRWHFGPPQLAARTRFLVNRQGRSGRPGRLDGYATVMREDAPDLGLRRLKIVDMFMENDAPDIFDRLLFAAHEYARAERCHVLELVGLPENLRAAAMRHRPLVRAMPTWPLYYKAIADTLVDPLSNPQAWYVTPYDGDTALV